MTNRTIISKIWRAVLVGALLVFACKTASAQRTISGQPTLALSAYYTGSFVGAEAFFQQYTLGGFWEAGAFATPIEFMTRKEAASIVDLSKLPEDASETLRIVRVGDYDACACIGAHVNNTSEIGTFKILSHDFEDGRWRVRWKVIEK